jgi:hypothetical protein
MIKLLDIEVVKEVYRNMETPSNTNKKVVDELMDFFNFDIIIIPVFYSDQDKSLVIVVENQLNDFRDRIVVTLYDREREEDDEDENEGEGKNIDDSNIFHAIIQLVLGEGSEDQYEHKIEGLNETLDVTNENDMISAILQIAESKVLHEGRIPNESVDDYKHKILDRLIAFHLI